MFILIFFILFNYVTISTSNTQGGIISSNNLYMNEMQNQIDNQNYSIPSPVQSKAPTALNSKINLNEHTYDYNQQFFVPSPTVFNNQVNLNNPPYNYKQYFFV